MKTWRSAGGLILGALISMGCATSSSQGAQVRIPTTTAASGQAGSFFQRSGKSHHESPLARECKAGSSKACNEVGDRLVIKHAHQEARQWYVTSCERVRGSMVPTAERLLRLSRDITQLGNTPSDENEALAVNQHKMTALKSDVSELRARIQGCFDVGELMKADGELKQSLAYHDVACEFSTLVEALGESVPGLELVSGNGCAEGRSARTKLHIETPFTPELFLDLTEERQAAADKQSPAKSENSMVFNAGDL